MSHRYDLIVVGAGPAGSAAAYHAASAGLTTLLVDRKRFPRGKVCGDGLTPRAVRALSRLGLGPLLDRHTRIRGVRVVNGSDSRVVCYPGGSASMYGAVVPRRVLDDAMLRAARGAGADFAEETAVTALRLEPSGRVTGCDLDTPQGPDVAEARLTIVADGATGSLSRHLLGATRSRAGGSARRQQSLAVRQYWSGVEGLAPYFEVHVPLVWRGRPYAGYRWIFPLSATEANVGVGFLEPPSHAECPSLRDVLARFVRELVDDDRRFRRARPSGLLEGGVLASQMADPSRLPPGVLLVGDAAGLVHPFTGEGIGYAIESGEIAARTAIRCLRDGSRPATLYGRDLTGRLRRQWALRGSRRHVTWLVAAAAALHDGHAPDRLIAAARQVITDDVSPPCGWTRDLPVARERAAIRRLAARVRTRLLRTMRRMDLAMAELVVSLFDAPDSAAALPLTIAGALAPPATLRNPEFLDAMLTLVLFGLAQSLLVEVEADRDDPSAQAHNAAALVIGDCLTTEATTVMFRLPDPVCGGIARASLRAARALALCTRTSPPPARSLAQHYADLAAPSACAARLARLGQDTSPAGVIGPSRFARWYAAARLALAAARTAPGSELARYLERLVDGPLVDPPHGAMLAALDAQVRRDARALLAASPSPRARAARS